MLNAPTQSAFQAKSLSMYNPRSTRFDFFAYLRLTSGANGLVWLEYASLITSRRIPSKASLSQHVCQLFKWQAVEFLIRLISKVLVFSYIGPIANDDCVDVVLFAIHGHAACDFMEIIMDVISFTLI